jgi:hypothetical protein
MTVMGRSFKDIFIVVFPLTGALFGVLVYFLLRLGTIGPNGMTTAAGLGFICGMVFGIGVGYFVRSLDYSFDIDPSINIAPRLQTLIMGMGYRYDTQLEKIMTFEPTVRAGMFADRIRVELMPRRVRLEGPHWHIQKIRTTLRV